MTRRGRLDVPVIGVARSKWTLEQFRARAIESIEHHAAAGGDGGGVDRAALSAFLGRLRYVSGEYAEPATYAAIRKELGDVERPIHYLAVPPSLFATVVEGLAGSGCAEGARLIVEKPFGRDRASAGELNRTIHGSFDESAIFRIDHYLGKECRTCSSSGSRTRFWSRSGARTTWRGRRCAA